MKQTEEKTQAQIQYESNLFCRKALGFGHHKIETTAFYPEEFEQVLQTKGVIASYCEALQQKIEAVEPKTEAAPAKPYIMEVPTPQPVA